MILEIKDICFERENKKILDNINLKIELGKFIAITGQMDQENQHQQK